MTKTIPQSKNETGPKSVNKGIFKWLLVVFLLLVLAGFAWVYSQYSQFVSEPISNHKTVIHLTIAPGSSVTKVANQLHQQGFMAEPKWFAWYVRYQNKQQVIKAGEFEIQPQWTVDELLDGLENAKNIQYPVTIVAGHTVQQTLKMIQALPKIKQELDIDDIQSLQTLLNIEKTIDTKYPYANIEGLLLPETYHYEAGDSDKEIVLRAHQALQATLDQAWRERDKNLPYQTPYQALTMASIVEKETGISSERPLIAGVFIRRMKIGMRLQTDPTVIYGIGQSYDGNIRKKDLLKKTAYNTYKIDGLPPTPIALPSAEAIQAALKPAKTKALYFVAKGGGEHYFSKTLEEHNRAVQKYLLSK
ncbi:endolytic murein transglycosylase [Thiomicrorhabdus immobilis]|uniref:Endolytic murein transglycosylase n=1 Tax=Thiomicrorhabdus immobilis TaxID=2791037 RepID=A0ABN6CVL8_9GAMM|nr:endolytic transglycosylase MltG [Thiomicrorhabdus immobilis]BCN93061.1 endolytic murein transglycosylase [Thiomicrorhabdus immobilis]